METRHFYNYWPRRLFKWMGYIVRPDKYDMKPSYMLYGILPLLLLILSVISLFMIEGIDWFVLAYHIGCLFYKILISVVCYMDYAKNEARAIENSQGVCYRSPNPFFYELVFRAFSFLIMLLVVMIIAELFPCSFFLKLCLASVLSNFLDDLYIGLKAFFAVKPLELDM